MASTDDGGVIATPRGTRRRPCGHCGFALGRGHGNQRYHADCGPKAKAERQRRNAAAYRARRAGEQGHRVPDDFAAGRVVIPGVVLPGARTAAIRLAANQTTVAARTFHDALKTLNFEQVLKTPELMALRTFADEVLAFLDVLNDSLPIPRIKAQSVNPKEGLDAATIRHAIRLLTPDV